jgi:uncharacterized protein YciI
MFVVIINYTKPIEHVDAVRTEHLAWIKENADAGRLVLAGRQTSGKGGVLIFNVGSRAEVEALCKNDPYAKNAVANYDYIEFDAKSGALAAQLATAKA